MITRNHQGYRVGESHGNAKVSDKLVAQIVAEFRPRIMGYKKLSKKYGISANTIKDWVNGVTRGIK